MRRTARVVLGVTLVMLACGVAVLSHGVARAGQDIDAHGAAWQSNVTTTPPEAVGAPQKAGERLLGIHASNELLRSYQAYRAGLADVIEGTLYPQTQARWNLIAAIRRLRPSLRSAHDRAAADVTLGVVYAASAVASGPGQQRQALQRNAIATFRRAVLEDPANEDAKVALELLLAATGDATSTARSTDNGQDNQQGTPSRTPRARPVGTGY
jgi:hypothetical protein